MSRYRRSRIELYIDILQAIYRGKKSPARIVYAANLSYDRVIQCIAFLEEHNLVNRIGDEGKTYNVTERGVELLQSFSEVENNLLKNKQDALKRLPSLQ